MTQRGKSKAQQALQKLLADERMQSIMRKRIMRNAEQRGVRRCWPWNGNKDWRGMARVYLYNTRITVHQVLWVLEYGEVPAKGLAIFRSCGNRMCVNPDHLMLKKRGYHKSTTANLPPDTVDEIRQRLAAGELGYKIAEDYGVWPSTISKIKRGTRGGVPVDVPPRGLDCEAVRDIRRRLQNGEVQRVIAADHGVRQSVVSGIKLGKMYKGRGLIGGEHEA